MGAHKYKPKEAADYIEAAIKNLEGIDPSAENKGLKFTDPEKYWTDYYADMFSVELTFTEDKNPNKKEFSHPLFSNPAEMVRKAIKYFVMCKVSYEPITMTGAALALGFSTRGSFINYAKRDDEWKQTIEKIKTVYENFAESMLFTKFNNGAKFSLLNQGWELKETRIIQEQSFEVDMKKPEE